ncbi:hypothetical protein CQA53_06900 [Helicobacter didelphidarum]|uniref:PH domain-containing protein n=1 Tax=Helicobacter didelphidarum TaxID=2040648 RepID=A0A3D8IKY3_9HELI|nr:hypothetical protein [Helicobacter didelphidarum]RDU65294.1 hypothetical protein CQA53_06900 [Helicobacter didelphidarum]
MNGTKKKEIESWLDSLKIALLESDSQKAFEITQNLPFNTDFIETIQHNDNDMLEYLNIAKELITQTIHLLHENKNSTRMQLDKIRQTRLFFM